MLMERRNDQLWQRVKIGVIRKLNSENNNEGTTQFQEIIRHDSDCCYADYKQC